MTTESSAGEKSHQPTAKRLDDARLEGDIPKSAEFFLAATYAVLLLILVTFGGDLAMEVAGSLAPLLGSQPSTTISNESAKFLPDLRSSLAALVLPVAALLVAPLLAVTLALAAQRAFVFVPNRLAFKANRISPLTAIKNRFGLGGLFEFGKSVTKLVLVGVLAAWLIGRDFDNIANAAVLTAQQFSKLLMSVFVSFLTGLTLLTAVIAVLDYFWQHGQHRKKLRMSHEDLRKESKESDGDPHMKAQRHRRGNEIATNRMLQDVPQASVIIVNPTHFAVALTWNKAKNAAPICVAKGSDEVAAKIRQIAAAAGVPCYRDAVTARALHASVEIGREIQALHYRSVAAAIQFAERMRKTAKERQGR